MVTLLKAQLETVSFVSWASGPSTEILIPGTFIECPQLAMKGMLTLMWFSLVGDHYSGQGKAVGTEALSREGSWTQHPSRQCCFQNPEVQAGKRWQAKLASVNLDVRGALANCYQKKEAIA